MGLGRGCLGRLGQAQRPHSPKEGDLFHQGRALRRKGLPVGLVAPCGSCTFAGVSGLGGPLWELLQLPAVPAGLLQPSMCSRWSSRSSQQQVRSSWAREESRGRAAPSPSAVSCCASDRLSQVSRRRQRASSSRLASVTARGHLQWRSGWGSVWRMDAWGHTTQRSDEKPCCQHASRVAAPQPAWPQAQLTCPVPGS